MFVAKGSNETLYVLAGAIVAGCIIATAIDWVENHSKILLTAVFLVGGVLVLLRIALFAEKKYSNHIAAKNAEEVGRQSEVIAQHALANAVEAQRKTGLEIRRQMDQILSADRVLIDTNIWLDEEDQDWLRLFAEASLYCRGPLNMAGAEFEEIVRLKESSDNGKAAKARRSLHFIEELQSGGRLTIARVPMDNVRNAYFDRVVQQMAAADLAAGRSVAVITNDTELRIRLRERNRRFDESQLRLFSGQDLIQPVKIDPCFYRGFRRENPKGSGVEL